MDEEMEQGSLSAAPPALVLVFLFDLIAFILRHILKASPVFFELLFVSLRHAVPALVVLLDMLFFSRAQFVPFIVFRRARRRRDQKRAKANCDQNSCEHFRVCLGARKSFPKRI